MSDHINTEMLGGWCKVGSKVVSDFYVDESDYIRTVTKLVVHPDSLSDRIKNSNGLVWTDEGIDTKTRRRGRPLIAVTFIDFIKPNPTSI